MNNLNFALDTMTRTIRTGFGYHCGISGQISSPQNCRNGDIYLVFTDDHGDIVEYRYNSGNEQIERQTAAGGWLPLTAPEVRITDMRFYVTGAGFSDVLQPTVTISIRGIAGLKTGTETDFDIQTTVTQRIIDG